MTDSTPAAGQDQSAQQAIFNLQRVYLKDCSLEIPEAPTIFIEGAEPKLQFELDTADVELGQDLCEVSIRCTVTCHMGDKVGFLIEATQSAIFEIKGVSDEQRVMLKGISCPNIVYPYLRANMADVVQRSSFPPVHLAEINWEAFFQQKMARLAAQQAEGGASDSGIILPQ
jgi:preprotein translocase subunit SecB